VATVAVALAFCGWEGTLTHQSSAAHWSTGAVIAVTFVVAVALGRGRQPRRSANWLGSSLRATIGWRRRPGYAAGVAVWAGLILAVIGWDLNSFAHQVHTLPTLSYEIGRVTRFAWGRAAVYALWLATGAALVSGQRRQPAPPSQEDP